MNHQQITKHAVYRGNSSHNTSVKILYFRLISRITNYVFIIVNYPLNVILPTRQTQKRSSNALSINTGSRRSQPPRGLTSICAPVHTSYLLHSLFEKDRDRTMLAPPRFKFTRHRTFSLQTLRYPLHTTCIFSFPVVISNPIS